MIDNLVEILDKLINLNKEFTISIDSLKVNSLKFAETIMRNLFYRLAAVIKLTK